MPAHGVGKGLVMDVDQLYTIFNAHYTDFIKGLAGVVKDESNDLDHSAGKDLANVLSEAIGLLKSDKQCTVFRARFASAAENRHNLLIRRDETLFAAGNGFLGTLVASPSLDACSRHLYARLHDAGRSALWSLLLQIYQVSTVIGLCLDHPEAKKLVDVMLGVVGASQGVAGPAGLGKHLTPGVMGLISSLGKLSEKRLESVVSTLQTVLEVFAAASDGGTNVAGMSNMLDIVVRLRGLDLGDEKSVLDAVRASGLVPPEYLDELREILSAMAPEEGEITESDLVVRGAWCPT